MPASELLELAREGAHERFEARCLELLENGQLKLADLVGPFEQLEKTGQTEQLAGVAQTVLDLADARAEPRAALKLLQVALTAAPDKPELRELAAVLYRALYGQTEGFDIILKASGIEGGRPIRMASKLLDLCLTLQPGDTLISRMDDRVAEVTEIDRANGLFTLRQEGRVTTRPAPEVVREFDRIVSDDFRVLRQLRPEQLASLIEEDPVKVVIGLIHAHGELIDADQLKHDLVPRYIPSKDWSKWWTRARGLLKRNPHVIMEGRSPIILQYSAEGMTLEEETWEALGNQRDPVEWMNAVESYLREKSSRKEKPDEELLLRISGKIADYIEAVREYRLGEALTCALVLERLGEKGLPLLDDARSQAVDTLRAAPDAGLLLREVPHDSLRERGLEALKAARPDDWAVHALNWLRTAPAGLLDKLASEAVDAGHTENVQAFIDAGLADPVHYPELLYWIWKGPKKAGGLRVPPDDELFRLILDTLTELGRTTLADAEVVKQFRHRTKAALALRDYAKARGCLEQLTEAAAIPIRRQLDRLDGLGDTMRLKLLDMLRDAHPQLWVVKPKYTQPWEDRETLWATTEGVSRRTAERDQVVNVEMPANAKRIGEAASHGDLSENSEYKFALEERDLLRARLATLNDELSRSRTLSEHDVPEDHVGIGTRVKLRRVSDGDERVMTFLGPFETDVDRGVFSYLAPVSQKLMGCRAGDHISLLLDGQVQELEIVSIENALARRL